jgi:hypothetical protein
MLRPFKPQPLPFPVPLWIRNNCWHMDHHLNFFISHNIVISFSAFAFPSDFGPFKMLDKASECF